MRSALFILFISISTAASCQKYFLFIGTYTGNGSKGIYVYTFDATTGKAQWISNTEAVVNPSYLAVAPSDTILYACNETNAGSISAFHFNRVNGQLTFINKQSSGGDNPAYVSVHKSGRWVTAANYSSGNLSVFPLNTDGSLQPNAQLVQHTGNSINKSRQDKPHVHSTVFSPGGDYLLAQDLGLDKVMIYKFNAALQNPVDLSLSSFPVTPGSGPRHLVFHPNKKFAYLIEEMGGAVSAYTYHKGKLQVMQRIITHADTATGDFGSADIHISPDGKFLYASNRGRENNIAVFSISKKGKLFLKEYQPTMGIQPRNFMIDPSGKYLLAANQKTGNIVIFKRDETTGLLKYTGQQINIPQPVCLKMIPVPAPVLAQQ